MPVITLSSKDTDTSERLAEIIKRSDELCKRDPNGETWTQAESDRETLLYFIEHLRYIANLFNPS